MAGYSVRIAIVEDGGDVVRTDELDLRSDLDAADRLFLHLKLTLDMARMFKEATQCRECGGSGKVPHTAGAFAGTDCPICKGAG